MIDPRLIKNRTLLLFALNGFTKSIQDDEMTLKKSVNAIKIPLDQSRYPE